MTRQQVTLAVLQSWQLLVWPTNTPLPPKPTWALLNLINEPCYGPSSGWDLLGTHIFLPLGVPQPLCCSAIVQHAREGAFKTFQAYPKAPQPLKVRELRTRPPCPSPQLRTYLSQLPGPGTLPTMNRKVGSTRFPFGHPNPPVQPRSRLEVVVGGRQPHHARLLVAQVLEVQIQAPRQQLLTRSLRLPRCYIFAGATRGQVFLVGKDWGGQFSKRG